LLLNWAVKLAQQGAGFTVLDPGGDFARDVLRRIPPEREANTLYIDAANTENPFPFNVLWARDKVERSTLIEEMLTVFQRLHSSSWGSVLAHHMRMALSAVLEHGGTLRDVYDLFTNDATRERVLSNVHDPNVLQFWRDEFPSLSASRHASVTNKLAPIVFHPVLGKILCARSTALDPDHTIRRRQIIIANLATGTTSDNVTEFLGTFLVQKLVAAAFRQVSLPNEARCRHVIIVDEFQRFVHKASAFDRILAEARKYKLVLIVANQFVEQLSPAVRAALFGNVGCLAAFRVGHRDARILAPEFAGSTPDELLDLRRGQCLVRIGNDWTFTRTLPPPMTPEDDPSNRIVRATRDHACRDGRTDDREPVCESITTPLPEFDETFEIVK
jgi:hypothetical protein